MRWLKRLGLATLIVGLLASGLYWLWWASTQSPEFYRVVEQQLANPVERKHVAQEFVEQSQQFVEEMKTSPQWTREFTDAQINAWLIEDFPREFADAIPSEVSQPRVKIGRDGIRIGVKVDQAGQWNGIVSVHLKARMLAPNEVAIELKSIQAGLVPVPLKSVIEQINEQAQAHGIEVEWRREGDHELAIVRVTHEGPESPQLEQIEFREGAIRVTGSSPPKSGALQFAPVRLTQSHKQEAPGF